MTIQKKILLSAACVAALLLVACGKKPADTTPVVAKVNNEEITTQQLEQLVKQVPRQPGVAAPDNAQALERLVDQRLASQKAEKDKLDRNPGVVQALEAARRDALARVYLEQLADKVPKPTPAEVKAYYDSKPNNFAQRRVFTIQKVDAAVPRDQAAAIAGLVQAAKSPAEVIELLKARNFKTNVTQSMQPAETLGPLVDKFSAMQVNQTIAIPQQFGLSALSLVAVQPMPVTLETANPAIERSMLNDRQRAALTAEAKTLRDNAKIEYLGKFAPRSASAPVAGSSAAASTVTP